MEEQKNLNNPPVSQPVAASEPKSIPTIAGVMIVLCVAVIVGAGIFYVFQTYSTQDFSSNNAALSNKSLKSKTETAPVAENATAPQSQAAEVAAQPATEETATPEAVGTTFNFDYELKKLDEQNNSISSDDFNENEMSDANIGL